MFTQMAAAVIRTTEDDVKKYERGLYLQNVLLAIEDALGDYNVREAFYMQVTRTVGEGPEKPPEGLKDTLIVKGCNPVRYRGFPDHEIMQFIVRHDTIIDCTSHSRDIIVRLGGRKAFDVEDFVALFERIGKRFKVLSPEDFPFSMDRILARPTGVVIRLAEWAAARPTTAP
jgi:hypothetical protein